MTGTRTRFFASLATFIGLLAGGFEAQLAPQSNGWWHGVTGAPTVERGTGALVAAALVWVLGRGADTRPLLGMGVGLLPFIPALTGHGSMLLVFTGQTCLLLFVVLAAISSRDFVRHVPALGSGLVFAIAFSFFVLVGRYLPGPAGPQGDEPHYLLIAASLLEDGDVDLQNQFANRDYRKFTSADLEPHTAPRSPKGRLYAIHTPGLSALVAPGYALSGFTGARAVLSSLMALVVSLLFIATRAWFGPATAAFVFLLATFASPLPIYANSLFPDSAATLSVAAVLAWFAAPRGALLGLASFSIASLPWLHPRFLPLAVLLAASVAVRGDPSWRRAAAVLVPLSGSLGLLLLHFQQLFGRVSLSAAYGPGFSSDVSILKIPWGASALILDRQFGLLLFAPVLLLGLPGIARLWPREKIPTAVLVAASLVTLSVGGSFSMWWGGASSPARFLIAAVPALIVACGGVFSDTSRPDRRALVAAGSGFGMGLLWLACLAPRALHNRSDGESGLLRLLTPLLDVDRFFPGFVTQATSPWLACVWAGVIVGALYRPRYGMALLLLPATFAGVASPRPVLDPFGATLHALENWNDHRRTFGGEDREEAFSLDVPLGQAAWNLTPETRLYSPRFSLPQGRWTITVESRTDAQEGVLNASRIALVTDDESHPPLVQATLKAGEPVVREDFILESDERRLHIRGEGLQSRTVVLHIRLAPSGRSKI